MNSSYEKEGSELYSLKNIFKKKPQGIRKKTEGSTSLLDRNFSVQSKPLVPITKPSLQRPGLSNMAINAPQEGRSVLPEKKTLSDWGGGKFAGSNMTTDQFVSLAGALAHAIAPDTPQGRVGSVLSRFGAKSQEKRLTAEKEKSRREYEKPEKELKRRVSMAQLLKAERPEKPTEFPTYLKSKVNQINPSTGKAFTGAEAVIEYKKLGKAAAREVKKYNVVTSDKGAVTVLENGKVITTTKVGVGKTKKVKKTGLSASEKWKQTKDIKAAKQNMLDPALIEDPRIQTEIDFVNEYGGEPYFYQRIEGTPGEKDIWFDGKPGVEAIPSTIEKIDVSTPEKIRDSDLPYETKLKLLQTRFGFE